MGAGPWRPPAPPGTPPCPNPPAAAAARRSGCRRRRAAAAALTPLGAWTAAMRTPRRPGQAAAAAAVTLPRERAGLQIPCSVQGGVANSSAANSGGAGAQPPSPWPSAPAVAVAAAAPAWRRAAATGAMLIGAPACSPSAGGPLVAGGRQTCLRWPVCRYRIASVARGGGGASEGPVVNF